MTEADRILLAAELAASEAKARTLREALGGVAESAAPAPRPKAKRDRGPKPPTDEERARAESSLDERAWARYAENRSTRRAG